LETKINAYQSNRTYIYKYDLVKQITDLKKDCPWLYEICNQSLQQTIFNLDTAFKNFFRNKKHFGFPKFKNKKSKQSFKIMSDIKIDFENKKISIIKFRDGIKFALNRSFSGQIKQATVSKVSSGKYFISITVNNKQEPPFKAQIEEKTSIGIDLGINSLFTLSDGTKFDNPRYLNKSLKKLKVLQRKYSKFKGRKNKHKITILYEHIANQRKDNLHKISTQLIRDNQSIALEDLNISDMMKKCKPKQSKNGKYIPNGQNAKSGLNRSIHDAGWGIFVLMLEHKAEWYGKNILKIGRFEPSSKTCSGCGHINQDLKLNNREWKCPECGTTHDRDVNAAINIKNFALSKNKTVCGVHTENQKELPRLLGAMTSEAHRE